VLDIDKEPGKKELFRNIIIANMRIVKSMTSLL
jgi:hypothetical protein